MKRFSRTTRHTVFLAVVWAMLLQAAVPMLAAWAAQRQGVPVGEVCEVHGVAMPRTSDAATVAHEGDDDTPLGATHASGSSHCALLALGALAPPMALPPANPPRTKAIAGESRIAQAQERDDQARWIARLHHGPPTQG